MSEIAVNSLEDRIAKACAVWGRGELTPIVLKGKRTWAVRVGGGRFKVAESVGVVLDDSQLTAVVGYHLSRSLRTNIRAWSPYALFPLAFVLAVVATVVDAPSFWVSIPMGLMLLNAVLVFLPATYGWAEGPQLDSFVQRGGDLSALAAGLWKLIVITWGNSSGMGYAVIGFQGLLGAMAERAGCAGEDLLRKGGIEVRPDDPEETASGTWWQAHGWWLKWALLIAVLLALRFWRGRS